MAILRAIRTRYHSAKGNRQARIVADDGHGNTVNMPWIPTVDEEGNHRQAAQQLMAIMGWLHLDCQGGMFQSDVYWTLKQRA